MGNLLVLSTVLLGGHAYAEVDSKVSVGLEGEWTDNVFLASTDKTEDFLTSLELGLDVTGREAPYEFGMQYNLRHDRYLDQSFGDQNFLDGTGYFNVSIVPRALIWYSGINSSVTSRDAVGPNTQANRDQRHALQTGISYNMFVSRRDQLSLDASVTGIRFREADVNDNNSAQVGVSWSHGISALSKASLGCSVNNTLYISDDFEYNGYLCQLGYTRQLKKGDFEFNLGQRTMDLEDLGTADSLVYNMRLTWQETKHQFSILSLVDLQDSSQGLDNNGFSGGSNPIDINTDQRALTIRKRFETQYTYLMSRADQIRVVAYLDSDDIYKSTEDTDRTGIDLSYQRRFNQDYNGRLSYSFLKTEFAAGTPIEVVNYQDIYRFRLNRIFSNHFNAYGEIRAEIQNTDSPLGQDYEAYFFMLGMLYTFD